VGGVLRRGSSRKWNTCLICINNEQEPPSLKQKKSKNKKWSYPFLKLFTLVFSKHESVPWINDKKKNQHLIIWRSMTLKVQSFIFCIIPHVCLVRNVVLSGYYACLVVRETKGKQSKCFIKIFNDCMLSLTNK
jgi:hypothetical protein